MIKANEARKAKEIKMPVQQLVKVMMVVIQQQTLAHFLVVLVAAVLVQLVLIIILVMEIAITSPEETVVLV